MDDETRARIKATITSLAYCAPELVEQLVYEKLVQPYVIHAARLERQLDETRQWTPVENGTYDVANGRSVHVAGDWLQTSREGVHLPPTYRFCWMEVDNT